MNRPIKFRVKNDGVWHYATLKEIIEALGFDYGLPENIMSFMKESEKLESITQYTGLNDRDGKEIYEGDILKHPDYCNGELSGFHVNAVIYEKIEDEENYLYKHHLEYIIGANTLIDVYQYSEIIGNIFENPELIK